mgnify:CR=1 FL=1
MKAAWLSADGQSLHGAQMPDQRDDDDRHNPADDVERNTYFQIVAEFVSSGTQDHQIRLIPQRSRKSVRRGHRHGQEQWTRVHAGGLGGRQRECPHDGCAGIVAQQFGQKPGEDHNDSQYCDVTEWLGPSG